MSYGTYSSQRYLETSILTATPEQLVVMMYEGAIRHLKLSITHIEERNLEGKRLSINKSLEIINGLRSALDMTRGQDIAVELRRIYSYVSSKIVEGSIQLKTDPINEAVQLMSTLLESWREVAIQRQKQANTMTARMVG